MRVGEVCNREVVITDRNATLLETAKLMRQKHVGDVVVVDDRPEGRYPIGILTDRDIVVELIAEEVDVGLMLVGDCMSFDLVTARENDELFPTIKRMRDKGIRRLPVVDEAGLLIGILTVDDLIDLIAEQLTDLVRLMGHEQDRERTRRA
ncbi:MAG: CBS domain-containing protein [Syntrophotaleaceae bacterium]